MKNYSKITENKDILTEEYADSIYAKKSSVPAAVTESTVSGWGFTKNKGTVTSVAVKMNGATKGTVTSSGTIDLGTVITSHQDISGLMPKSGGAFTGNISVPKTITFIDETNPFIKMRTGSTDFYFQSTSGQFGLGPTWDKATHWDSNGNVTFPTVPKVGNSLLALKSDIPTIPTLAEVATTGSYTDLSNTPTILSEADVKGIKVNNAAYADSTGYVKNSMVYQGVGMNADANYSNFVTYNGSAARSIKFYKYDFQMQDALGSGDAELTLRSTGVTAGTYNSVTVDKKGRVTAGTNTPAVDTSNFAKLDAENTFAKGQVITGGTSGGYSIDASGYIRGSWLQASSTTNKGSNTGKVCVFDGNGWIYYRTPSEILSEASGVPKSAFSLSGTTLTITI